VDTEKPFPMLNGSMRMNWFLREFLPSIVKPRTYPAILNVSKFRSTDSTLKLWNVRSNECVRTYTGHVNEKNFVGLSTNNDWISCGSENNAVYTYYKSVRSPLACVKFGGFDALTVSCYVA
jgi:WD40 repeat protein